MVALGIVIIVGSFSERGDEARTSNTQAHGVRRAAQVISEDAGTGKSPTSTLTVRLSEPVNGRDTTTVHIQGAPAYSAGAPVTVVVDPQDPGYAELPGAPYTSSGFWVFLLGLGLTVILIIPFGTGVGYLVQLRRRRRVGRFLLR
jgi:hypothetical protein